MRTIADLRGGEQGAPPADPAAQRVAPGAPPPEASEPGEAATPEEQAAYEKIVLAATQVLYDDATHDQVVETLKAGARFPEQAIAQIAVQLLVSLDEQSNGTIPESILVTPLQEIIEQLGEIADAAGIFPVDEALINRAAQLALEQVAEIYGVEESELQAMMDSIPPEQAQAMRTQQELYARRGGGAAAAATGEAPTGGADGLQ